MTPGDTARVLSKAAAFDQRTVGETDVLAWHEAIGDLDAADALTAVSRYYGDVTERRIMPGHIRTLVGEIQRERHRETRLAIEAAEAHPTDPRPLTDRRPEIKQFVEQVRGALPAGDADALHWGRREWRREQVIHRERDDAPNPDFDPSMAAPVEWNRSKAKPETCWWADERARERHANELLAKAGRLRVKTTEEEAA